MEVMTHTENGELLAGLTSEYRALKDDYTLQGARRQMLDNLISGKFLSHTIDDFSPTVKLDTFLMKAKELSDNITLNNAPIEVTEDNHDSELEENIQLELARGQELLQRILKEQAVVMEAIMTSRQQFDKLSNTDLLESKENQAPTNTRSHIDIVIDESTLRSVQKSFEMSSDLLVGLRTLTGVKSLEVTESEDKSGVRLLITIGECSFALALNSDKRICDIKVINGKTVIDLKKLLQDSRVLPCPQDLRYAVFALGASQNAAESVKDDLAILRKSGLCIVRVTGPLGFELDLQNSVTVVVAVHECYPEVPAGVHIQSLSREDQNPKDIEFLQNIQESVNACSFRTISDMFNYLISKDMLGSGMQVEMDSTGISLWNV